MPGHPKNYRHLHEEPDTYSQRINKHMPSQSKATLHMLGKQQTAKYMLDHPSNRAYGHLTNDKVNTLICVEVIQLSMRLTPSDAQFEISFLFS